MTPFAFQRGETISLALDAVSGDPAEAGAIAASLKAVPPGRTGVAANAPVAASFVLSSRAATDENPAGWTLTIPAAVSATLAPGSYLADARIEIAGGVVVTDSVAIVLRESVTA